MEDFQKVISYAKSSRKIVERLAKHIDNSWPVEAGDSKTLECYCAIASHLLYKLAKKNNIKINFHVGKFKSYDHAFNSYDGKIIDITATQFGLKNKVYVIDSENPYYKIHFSNEKAIDYVEHYWPTCQTLRRWKTPIKEIAGIK
jgi:hypothetical protein